jgi:hypothetical protein
MILNYLVLLSTARESRSRTRHDREVDALTTFYAHIAEVPRSFSMLVAEAPVGEHKEQGRVRPERQPPHLVKHEGT